MRLYREQRDSEKLGTIFQIRCVKDMTTLRGLTDSDWTWKCDMDIREFFHDPSIPVLCVYHVDGDLTTEFSFPMVPVHELTYFVRQPNEILYPGNFRERILFGSLNDKVESHILDVIQNIFAPIFFTIETWPDSILSLSFAISLSVLLHFRQSTQLIRANNAESSVQSGTGPKDANSSGFVTIGPKEKGLQSFLIFSTSSTFLFSFRQIMYVYRSRVAEL